mmetsp:Transcript_26885/g.37436  ORF Transcript_26885/g.37436 Transcript_26885/m.37436 type:complete len:178 (-) Transcript_26885:44-577(-)
MQSEIFRRSFATNRLRVHSHLISQMYTFSSRGKSSTSKVKADSVMKVASGLSSPSRFDEEKFLSTIVRPYLESMCRWGEEMKIKKRVSKKSKLSPKATERDTDLHYEHGVPLDARGFPSFVLGRFERTATHLRMDMRQPHRILGVLAAHWRALPLDVREQMGMMKHNRVVKMLKRLQ